LTGIIELTFDKEQNIDPDIQSKDLDSIFNITVIPGLGSTPENTYIESYELVEVSPFLVAIQVMFANPIAISTGTTQDILSVQIIDYNAFLGNYDPKVP